MGRDSKGTRDGVMAQSLFLYVSFRKFWSGADVCRRAKAMLDADTRWCKRAWLLREGLREFDGLVLQIGSGQDRYGIHDTAVMAEE